MSSTHPERKQDQARIVGDDLAVLYLAFFFCTLVAYDLFLLKQYDVAYWNFGFALLNALVITKVIMIGEYAELGKRHENKSLLVSTLWKAVAFGLLVFAFHIVQEVVKRLIQRPGPSWVSARLFLCLPFREFRRVLREEPFHVLVFRRRSEEAETVSVER